MAHKVTLKNGSSFSADTDKTIFNSALESGITLDHSCLMARCMSCKAKVLKGSYEKINDETVLSDVEKNQGYILTCNTIPKSDLKLDIEDLGDLDIQKPRMVPAKIDDLERITDDVIRLILRLPPSNCNFKFLSGQYVNIIKGNIKRSYSIANAQRVDGRLEFFIKKYEKGFMSNYLFQEAKKNDLLRLQGPFGTFFYRKSLVDTVIFMATGTGIAPIKAILEYLDQNPDLAVAKTIMIFWGGRYEKDIYWNPGKLSMKFNFIPVLSRADSTWKGEKGYVQNAVLKNVDNLKNSQVYACGSNNMIESSRKLLLENGLLENHFYSDAFVSST